MLAAVRIGRSWANKFACVGWERVRGYAAQAEGTGEWWAVDGELFRNEKLNLKKLLEPLPNQHLPNKKRKRDRHKRLLSTRLKLKPAGQELYWNAYMLRYQAMRDEWEKLYWDSLPEEKNVPTPIRGDGWKGSQGYGRKGPYDERFPGHRFDRNRSAGQSFVPWNNKIQFKRSGMEQYPYDNSRDSTIFKKSGMGQHSYGSSRDGTIFKRSGMEGQHSYGSSRDGTIFKRSGMEQHTYGSLRNSDTAYGSRRDTGMPTGRVFRQYDRLSSGRWAPDK